MDGARIGSGFKDNGDLSAPINKEHVEQFVSFFKQGVSAWYELTQEAADSIWLWYEDMFAEYGG